MTITPKAGLLRGIISGQHFCCGKEITGMINLIKSRTSYRGKYKKIPVPGKDLTAIMEARYAVKRDFAQRAWFNGFDR